MRANFIRHIFPKTIDNNYRGNAVALILFIPITVVTVARSLIHIFAEDGGTQSIATQNVQNAVKELKKHTELPIAVGFGIKTRQDVADVTSFSDAAVVGSAVVNVIEQSLDVNGEGSDKTISDVLALVRDLAAGTRGKEIA